jgi:lysine 2,3-aminomutase
VTTEDQRAEEPDPGSIGPRQTSTTQEYLQFGPSITAKTAPTKFPIGAPASLVALASVPKRQRAPRQIEPINRFPISEQSRRFLRRHFPGVSVHDWNDWKWQVRNRIRRLETLEKVLELTPDERAAVEQRTGNLPIAITPYYLSLLSPTDPLQPLRRTHIPVGGEFIRGIGEDPDPLHEDHDTAVPGLVHRYPDRVLFLTTGFCSTYCRYCTRSRMVGETNGEYSFSVSQWEKAAQ